MSACQKRCTFSLKEYWVYFGHKESHLPCLISSQLHLHHSRFAIYMDEFGRSKTKCFFRYETDLLVREIKACCGYSFSFLKKHSWVTGFDTKSKTLLSHCRDMDPESASPLGYTVLDELVLHTRHCVSFLFHAPLHTGEPFLHNEWFPANLCPCILLLCHKWWRMRAYWLEEKNPKPAYWHLCTVSPENTWPLSLPTRMEEILRWPLRSSSSWQHERSAPSRGSNRSRWPRRHGPFYLSLEQCHINCSRISPSRTMWKPTLTGSKMIATRDASE